ncbi:gamma subclass chorismate mutase AroQ [Roseibium hamelinense]|nr:gamma subclass chorismate mutase AroQ [Roseibium hamelinense]
MKPAEPIAHRATSVAAFLERETAIFFKSMIIMTSNLPHLPEHVLQTPVMTPLQGKRRPITLKFRHTFSVILIIMGTSNVQAAPPDLFDTINDRLGYMQAVAAWKVENQHAIEDPAREKIVLKAASEAASKAGFNTDTVEVFFEAQIEAAKAIQLCWANRWHTGSPRPEHVPDLVTDVRPALISLGDKIIEQLSSLSVSPKDQADFNAAVRVDCLPEDNRNELFDALINISETTE